MAGDLASFLNYGYKSPSLGLGQGPGLHNLYCIANAALIVLIMRGQLVCPLNDLTDYGMLNMVLDRYDNCLVHLVADDFADTDFSKISFHVYLLSVRFRLTLPCCS